MSVEKEKSTPSEKEASQIPVLPKPDEDASLEKDERAFFDIQHWADKIRIKRKNPLLLLFYSDKGQIELLDTDYLEKVLEKKMFKELDLVIHTRGGDVSGSYFLAQVIRMHCEKLNIIVPHHSYSGGTVIALSGDQVYMGSCSRLSPIDVQLNSSTNSIPLINFDKAVEFIIETSKSFNFQHEENTAKMATELLCRVFSAIQPMDIGELHRLRSLHWYYSKKLLTSYMFKNHSEREAISDFIVKKLTSDAPTHNFDIDRNIARDFGINVVDLDDETYDWGKKLISACVISKKMGIICPFISIDRRMPFFYLWGDNDGTK